MNVQLAPALIIEELTEQNRQLDAQLENFQSVIAAVDAYRNEERLRLLQSSTLLKVVDDLLMKFCSEAGHQTVLFGTKSCPGIMINQDDDRNLRVQFSQMDKFVNLDGGSGPIGVHIPGSMGDRMHLTNYREREIVISPAYSYTGRLDPFNASGEVRNRFRYTALSENEFNLSESIINSAVAVGIGFLPGGGAITGTGIAIGGEGIGILSEYNNIKRVREQIKHISDVGDFSELVYSERLNVVFISENQTDISPQLWFSSNNSTCNVRDYIPEEVPRVS